MSEEKELKIVFEKIQRDFSFKLNWTRIKMAYFQYVLLEIATKQKAKESTTSVKKRKN
jgi:hypothetical protein